MVLVASKELVVFYLQLAVFQSHYDRFVELPMKVRQELVVSDLAEGPVAVALTVELAEEEIQSVSEMLVEPCWGCLPVKIVLVELC